MGAHDILGLKLCNVAHVIHPRVNVGVVANVVN